MSGAGQRHYHQPDRKGSSLTPRAEDAAPHDEQVKVSFARRVGEPPAEEEGLSSEGSQALNDVTKDAMLVTEPPLIIIVINHICKLSKLFRLIEAITEG